MRLLLTGSTDNHNNHNNHNNNHHHNNNNHNNNNNNNNNNSGPRHWYNVYVNYCAKTSGLLTTGNNLFDYKCTVCIGILYVRWKCFTCGETLTSGGETW